MSPKVLVKQSPNIVADKCAEILQGKLKYKGPTESLEGAEIHGVLAEAPTAAHAGGPGCALLKARTLRVNLKYVQVLSIDILLLLVPVFCFYF